jgi:hypothetical protein
LKNFTRVFLQQGRVQVDADWNEQTSILLHYLRALTADLIGPHGGPDPDGAFTSFAISSLKDTITDDFAIGAGRYYVNGLLCESASTSVPLLQDSDWHGTVHVPTIHADGRDFAEEEFVEIRTTVGAVKTIVGQIRKVTSDGFLTLDIGSLAHYEKTASVLRRIITYKTQPDWPEPGNLPGLPFLVYLDVWERHISCSQDDSIREVALGGPDTATRAKLVWQVGVDPELTALPIKDQDWRLFLGRRHARNRGKLRAFARKGGESGDPCIIRPEASYRGAENQLYRVEIHAGGRVGVDEPSFKWSRDNSSIEYPIRRMQPPVATLAHLWRDSRSALNVGDWVELVDDYSVLQSKPGILMKVESVGDPSSMTVTLKVPPAGQSQPASYDPGDPDDVRRHPILRRWDYRIGESTAGKPAPAADGALLMEEDKWFELEDGIEIQFPRGPDVTYRTGDYWLIPARTASGDIEWPVERNPDGTLILDADGNPHSAALLPHGIEHYYAPLAIVGTLGGGAVIDDCRKKFGPLAG